MDLIGPAVPFFLALIVLEVVLSARRARRGGTATRGYTPRDTAASLAMGVGSIAVGAAQKGASFALYQACFEIRLFDLGSGAWAFALALVGDDFLYYWFHRLHHEVRILWAAHVNHHSSRHYNLSTALRQSWTTFTSPLFYLPLPLLGIDPLVVVTVHSVNLLYQFGIHTELIDSLGPFERVFNTPSHHRVHHGRNVRYLDKNHGGILIVWDRWFGTFEPETEPVDYGLTTQLRSYNPLVIAAHEWVAMGRDAFRALRDGRVADALGHCLRPPGWSRDGHTRTARELQDELAKAVGAESAAESPA